MWWILACAAPDADALFRAHDLDASAAAFTAQTGRSFDAKHPAADALSRRSASDAALTMSAAADVLDAIHLLDKAPDHHLKTVDLPVEALAPLAACTKGWLSPPFTVAIGRSELPSDTDPITGGALPWKRGRYVGSARDEASLAALYVAADKDPPPRLTTVAIQDNKSTLYLYFARRDGAWLLQGSTDGDAAARYVLACSSPRSPAD